MLTGHISAKSTPPQKENNLSKEVKGMQEKEGNHIVVKSVGVNVASGSGRGNVQVPEAKSSRPQGDFQKL